MFATKHTLYLALPRPGRSKSAQGRLLRAGSHCRARFHSVLLWSCRLKLGRYSPLPPHSCVRSVRFSWPVRQVEDETSAESVDRARARLVNNLHCGSTSWAWTAAVTLLPAQLGLSCLPAPWTRLEATSHWTFWFCGGDFGEATDPQRPCEGLADLLSRTVAVWA